MSSIHIWRKHNQFPVLLGQVGHIITFTHIHAPAIGFESQSPFATGMIELRDGSRVFGQISAIDTHKIESGTPVRAVLRRGSDVPADAAVEYAIKWQVQ